MNRILTAAFAAVAALTLASPSVAQESNPHAGHHAPAPATASSETPPEPSAVDPHAARREMAVADPHAGHARRGADLPVGAATAPAAPTDALADGYFDPADMERARRALVAEHGGALVSRLMANIAEYKAGSGGGYRWGVEGWWGGDLNRLVVKTEGEGAGHGVEAAEIQALYSRAVGRYTDLQVGVRHDLEPGPSKTYAVLGFETLMPYWVEAEGAVFLSQDGDLRARLEASWDLRLTQRLVLQPQAELGLSAQDIPEIGIGSGATSLELGLRLRYEVRREFAPYVGVTWERELGGTADLARAMGEDVQATRFVIGLRAWF
jgi:copper resistance protein B